MLDHITNLLGLIRFTDQQHIARIHHNRIIQTNRDDQPFIIGAINQGIICFQGKMLGIYRHIAGHIGKENIEERVPRADIVPAQAAGRQHSDIFGAFHYAIINRLRFQRAPMGTQDLILFRRSPSQRNLRQRRRERRHLLFDFRQDRTNLPYKHAAIP